MTPTGLILGDKIIPCSKPVFNFNDHGLKFIAGKNGKPRKVKVKNIVLHWTAGEGNGKKVYDILQAKNLGIGFHIDPQGTIYQFADSLELATSGQGVVNPFSEGIEMSNYGFGTALDKKRPVSEQLLKGHKIAVAEFYKVQMDSMVALVTALCDGLSIPKQIPAKQGKFHAYELTAKQMDLFSGVLGHINIPKTTKVDPGLQPFQCLQANGFSLCELD